MDTNTSCTIQRTYQNLSDIWRRCLTRDRFTDPYEGILEELGRYFQLPLEKVRWICEHSAEMVAEEWQKTGKPRISDEIYSFYQAQPYWLFGTLRYHTKQTEPHGVVTANALQHATTGHHLDFGCGAATASLFFNALGWQTSLGDVSEPAVNFARWRFEQRGIHGTFYHLETDQLPPNTYDLITAFDVMASVADIPATLRRLHQSLKPGGYLVFNIDSRKPTAMTIWHLYDAHYPVIRHVREAGFRQLPKIPPYPLYCYQKIARSPLNAAVVSLFDRMQHNRIETIARKQFKRLVLQNVRMLLQPYKEDINKVRSWLSR
jgi:2-polyprenyl-3-methyl-5-hydroxy-6-metoxy-1,4-benzoquinol methylase